jgi:hypothetical protein
MRVEIAEVVPDLATYLPPGKDRTTFLAKKLIF